MESADLTIRITLLPSGQLRSTVDGESSFITFDGTVHAASVTIPYAPGENTGVRGGGSRVTNAGFSTSTACPSRKGTAANHCWHSHGIGGGSCGLLADGSKVSSAHGRHRCCHCGLDEPFNLSFSSSPVLHGPYAP